MKEQAQLREEMAYQYRLGNFEVWGNYVTCLACPPFACTKDYTHHIKLPLTIGDLKIVST